MLSKKNLKSLEVYLDVLLLKYELGYINKAKMKTDLLNFRSEIDNNKEFLRVLNNKDSRKNLINFAFPANSRPRLGAVSGVQFNFNMTPNKKSGRTAKEVATILVSRISANANARRTMRKNADISKFVNARLKKYHETTHKRPNFTELKTRPSGRYIGVSSTKKTPSAQKKGSKKTPSAQKKGSK